MPDPERRFYVQDPMVVRPLQAHYRPGEVLGWWLTDFGRRATDAGWPADDVERIEAQLRSSFREGDRILYVTPTRVVIQQRLGAGEKEILR